MKNTAPNIEALIFDVDGTLADTEETHRLAFNRAFENFELKWCWSKSDYRDLLKISGGKERIKYYSHNQKEGKVLSSTFINEIHNYKNVIYQSTLAEKKIDLRLGISNLITDLHRNKVKVGIATSSSFNNINRLLTTCIGRSWQDAFNEIETSDSTPAKKPDPSVYKNIISRLNVNPKYSIAIEDTPNGLQSANCAGLKTVVTVHEMTRNLDFPNAALVVDSIGTYEQPFKLIKGESFGFNYVSIGLLSKLIE